MQRPANRAPASGPTVPKRTALTGAERAHIRKRRLEGAKIPEIATEVGRSWSVVGRVAKQLDTELGVSRVMGPAPKYPPPPSGLSCRHCGKQLPYRSPSYAARGAYLSYCGRDCFLEDVRTGALVKCPECGTERWRPASHMHKLHCGHRCAHAARRPAQAEAHRQNPALLLGAAAKGLYGRTGSTLIYGRYAKVFAEARGNKPGPKFKRDTDAEIRELLEAGEFHRQISYRLGVSRKRISRVEREMWQGG
jgi:uncharacterized protein YerC